MTIAEIVILIIGIIGLIIGIVLCIASYRDGEDGEGILIGIIIAIVAVIMIIGPIVYSNTEAGKRAYKDQQSNFEGGMERVIKVYDINGTLIQEYEGTFDIETSNERFILFDDSLGKRHIIYNTTGTVIIDEK